MATVLHLICDGCGQPFDRLESKVNRKGRPAPIHVYCSAACTPKYEDVTRSCEWCGASFTVRGTVARNTPARCCSRECANFLRRRGETRTCKTCGTSFYMSPSEIHVPGRTGEYCSHACAGPAISAGLKGKSKSAAHRANMGVARRGVPILANRKPKPVLTCENCRKPYALKQHYPQSYLQVRRFCSLSCKHEYARLHPEQAAYYRGGRYPYYGPNWQHQARLARDRDSHTCQMCGKHQEQPRLTVHHIRPRSSYAEDYIAANDLTNLITLCRGCHRGVENRACYPDNASMMSRGLSTHPADEANV